MQHKCRITVLETKVFPELQERDDFYNMLNGRFCAEAWDAVSRYVYTGSIMHRWTNDERMMIAGLKNRISRTLLMMHIQVRISESGNKYENFSYVFNNDSKQFERIGCILQRRNGI